MRAVLIFLPALLAFATSDATANLGPGNGPWHVDDPENHGLSKKTLDDAATSLERRVPVRSCFLVARNGKLVYEN